MNVWGVGVVGVGWDTTDREDADRSLQGSRRSKNKISYLNRTVNLIYN